MMHEISESNWKQQVNDLRAHVQSARFLTAITGAGISIASGLPTIKGEVRGVRLEEFFRETLWSKKPDLYFSVYREILWHWRDARPNKAHLSLAQIGAWVITQNIDGLHRDAGNDHVIELHGNLRELKCDSCASIFGTEQIAENSIPRCPSCSTVLRPGITFEGEEVRHFSRATDWVGRADVLFVVGTKLNMAPVHLLPRIAHRQGAHVIWINNEAEKVLPKLCD